MPKQTKFILPFCALVLWSCKSAKIETIDFSDGSYEGELNRKKQKHGKGFFRWSDGSYYNGDYHSDKRHGKGRFLWSNGETYEGDYVEDERTGNGVYRWPDGSVYKGSFFKGKRHGYGSFTSYDGIRYEGDWFEDQQHGKGKVFFPNGNLLTGTWSRGELIASNSLPPSTSPMPVIPVEELPEVSLPSSPVKPEDAKPKIPVDDQPDSNNLSSSAEEQSFPEKSFTGAQSIQSQLDGELSQDVSSLPNRPNPETTNKVEEETDNLRSKPSINDVTPTWRGTAKQAETEFITELINGLDTIREKRTNVPYTGRMIVVDENGNVEGELNLKNGVMDGKEIYYDSNGVLTEQYIWRNGKKVN